MANRKRIRVFVRNMVERLKLKAVASKLKKVVWKLVEHEILGQVLEYVKEVVYWIIEIIRRYFLG